MNTEDMVSSVQNVFLALQPSRMDGDATSKTLDSKYEAVLQKIGLECIEFSVRLQKLRYGSGFTTQILAILL